MAKFEREGNSLRSLFTWDWETGRALLSAHNGNFSTVKGNGNALQLVTVRTFAPRNRANQVSLQNECIQMKFSNDLSFRSFQNRQQAPKALRITSQAPINEALIEARHELAHAEYYWWGGSPLRTTHSNIVKHDILYYLEKVKKKKPLQSSTDYDGLTFFTRTSFSNFKLISCIWKVTIFKQSFIEKNRIYLCQFDRPDNQSIPRDRKQVFLKNKRDWDHADFLVENEYV